MSMNVRFATRWLYISSDEMRTPYFDDPIVVPTWRKLNLSLLNSATNAVDVTATLYNLCFVKNRSQSGCAFPIRCCFKKSKIINTNGWQLVIVELVGIDQRGNRGYICEIDNNYTQKHLWTLARNFLPFFSDWRKDHHDTTQLFFFLKKNSRPW